jgi:hypothetical protein
MGVPALFLMPILLATAALVFPLIPNQAAAESGTPAWLVSLRPDLVSLGRDAEAAALCGQFRHQEDGAAVLSALDTLGSRELTGLDANFAENAILEGRAAALLSIQQSGRQDCPKLGADRLLTIQRQSKVPIRRWPQARS